MKKGIFSICWVFSTEVFCATGRGSGPGLRISRWNIRVLTIVFLFFSLEFLFLRGHTWRYHNISVGFSRNAGASHIPPHTWNYGHSLSWSLNRPGEVAQTMLECFCQYTRYSSRVIRFLLIDVSGSNNRPLKILVATREAPSKLYDANLSLSRKWLTRRGSRMTASWRTWFTTLHTARPSNDRLSVHVLESNLYHRYQLFTITYF